MLTRCLSIKSFPTSSQPVQDLPIRPFVHSVLLFNNTIRCLSKLYVVLLLCHSKMQYRLSFILHFIINEGRMQQLQAGNNFGVLCNTFPYRPFYTTIYKITQTIYLDIFVQCYLQITRHYSTKSTQNEKHNVKKRMLT